MDEQNEPLLKRADLRKYVGIMSIRDKLKDFPSHYAWTRSETEDAGLSNTLGKLQNVHDLLATFNSVINIAV